MKFANVFYPETDFGGYTDFDGTIAFYLRVNALLKPDFVVADLGCGRGAFQDDPCETRKNLHILKGKCAKVIGLDIDKAAENNPFLDAFHLITTDTWPLADASVDLIYSDNVLEHFERPEQFFTEAGRVLKPGGFLCFRTPNYLSYVSLLSSLIPSRHHAKILSKVQAQRKEEDVFPTYYRCNTVWRIRKQLRQHGFEGCVHGYEAEPSYLEFSKFVYRIGVLHQKLAPNFLKLSIFCFGRKIH